jgi:hypothetical protein
MAGKFTRKFDKKIMKKPLPEDSETDEQRRERLTREKFGAEMAKIMERLDYRADFLKERFPDMLHETDGISGSKYIFPPSSDRPRKGFLEFTLRPTGTLEALTVKMEMEIDGVCEKKSDYITFPVNKVDLEKANTFIEQSIFEFARLYTEGHP